MIEMFSFLARSPVILAGKLPVGKIRFVGLILMIPFLVVANVVFGGPLLVLVWVRDMWKLSCDDSWKI